MADEQPADQQTQRQSEELHDDSYSGPATRQTLRRLGGPLVEFLKAETEGATPLLIATLVALVWANVSGSSYASTWTTDLSIRLGGHALTLDLRHWVNDGLMSFFFFVVGLEARREFDLGELRDRHRVPLPALAAAIGMLLPIATFLAFNAGKSSAHGWGAAMSTDTAFALGVLALVGPRFSNRMRAFVVTVAVVDDLLALGVIAIAYSERIDGVALAVAGGLLVLMVAYTRLHIRGGGPYLLFAVAIWVAMHESGVDPVVVGLVMGLMTWAYPASREDLERASALFRDFREQPTGQLARTARRGVEFAISPNERLAQRFHPWSSYVIVPLFALANAGITIGHGFLGRAFSSPVTLGIVVGYVVGKPVGIFVGTWLAETVTRGRVKAPVGRGALLGAGAAAGIGFTVSLLIANRAFSGEQLDQARLGILTGALVSTLLSAAVFRGLGRLPYKLRLRLVVGRSENLIDLAQDVDEDVDHVRGPADAPVTIVEYGDFECPYCGRAEPAVRELLAELGAEVRYVYRQLPLNDVHPHAQTAAEAAEAAGAQGRFWEMHDLLFDHQDALTIRDLLRYAEELELDTQRFRRDLRDRRFAGRIARDVESAELSAVSGTPTFFVNGLRHHGAYDLATLKAAVKQARARTLVAA